MNRRHNSTLLFLSFGLAVISVGCFAIPLYVIRPFRHQGARELAIALFVKQIGPAVSLLCVLLVFAIACFVWLRAERWLPRILLSIFFLVGISEAYLSRLNVYELMFHPLGTPKFESAERVGVEPDDMVISVQVNGVHRAYPIREMAYHHVVNDTVAGEPIVGTY
jgi:hypothetical protein